MPRTIQISLLLWSSMIIYVRSFAGVLRTQKPFDLSHRSSLCRIRLYATTDKKRVVFLGTPEVAADSLKAIHEASLLKSSCFELSAVVTQPPARRKRKGKVEPSPVGKVADELGIQVLSPLKANDKDFLDALAELNPDVCITAAYGQYLPKRFLSTPKYGTVNIHPSLLPRWRGASPVQRSLEAGDNPVGCSVLFTVSKMDAGPIIAQEEMKVGENDTATTVLPALFQIGTRLLLEKLPDVLTGEVNMETALVQDEAKVVNADMIATSQGELKVWEESAETCHNRLRGFSMWPGAFMWFKVGDREDLKVKIVQTRLPAREDGTRLTMQPTDVVETGPTKKDGLYVVTHDGSVLELLTVQPVTRKAFPARDFANGYPGEPICWVQAPKATATA